MSGTKPTPGPWELRGFKIYVPGTEKCIAEARIAWKSSAETAANARLIVRAVNCHADLVDGCNALLGLFQLLCARDDAPAWLKDAFETNHRVTEARAALAKAGETE